MNVIEVSRRRLALRARWRKAVRVSAQGGGKKVKKTKTTIGFGGSCRHNKRGVLYVPRCPAGRSRRPRAEPH